jgi:DNA polymerase-4
MTTQLQREGGQTVGWSLTVNVLLAVAKLSVGLVASSQALVADGIHSLLREAIGDDPRPLYLGDEVKSISSENTFLRDTDDRPTLRACLCEQSADIAAKLAQSRLGALTVQVKVRYGDFTTLTRQISVEEPLHEAREIYRLGCWLLARERLVHRPLRLLGLGVSGLQEACARQLPLAFFS